MIIIGGVIAVVAIAAAFMLFSSSGDSNYSKLSILGDGTIPENGTLNVKLTNGENIALKDKEIHVTVRDSNGSLVFEKSATTYVNGVANIKLEGLSAGEYDVNITFDGDENYTSSSIAGKLTIEGSAVEEDTSNDDVDSTDDAVSDNSGSQDTSSSSTTQSRQSSSSSSSHRTSSSSSSSSSSSDNFYDENGNRVEPIIDENGNPTFDG